ncbi:MAG: RNA polymerase sigma factor [Planctomycetota bacterium]
MADDPRGNMVLGLFESHYERVYAFARRSLDASAAEDIAQDVFARLLDLPDLERREISVSYLLKIADNLVKRRYWRRRKLDEILEDTRTASGKPGRSAQADGGARWDATPTAPGELSTLRPCEREVVELVVCRGLSYQQAASALGVRVSDVNNWKHRGIQRLKQHAVPQDERRGDRQRGTARRGGGFGQRAS